MAQPGLPPRPGTFPHPPGAGQPGGPPPGGARGQQPPPGVLGHAGPPPGARMPAGRGWLGWYQPAPHTPSGLFPAAPPPARPTYREPHPVRAGGLLAGLGATALWLLVFGLLGRDLRGYVLSTLLAGTAAWLVALLLTRLGDRGVAAGIAMVTGVGWGIAAIALAIRWSSSGDWPLW